MLTPEALAAEILALCDREEIDLPTLTAAIQILAASAIRALSREATP